MASAYTPGLKVTRSTRVRKIRRLPLLGDVLVEKGTRVEPHDLVAKTMLPGEPTTINVAQRFNYDVSMREEIERLEEELAEVTEALETLQTEDEANRNAIGLFIQTVTSDEDEQRTHLNTFKTIRDELRDQQ